MDPSRWQRLNDIFQQALELDAADRPAFLENACPDDPVLRDEVVSLLEHHDRATSALEEVAAEAAGDLLAAVADELVPGQELGPYRIEGRLGAGGMGVVYVAEDTRLGRRVAIKALRGADVASPERRERLVREAKAAAALGDPGIARVFALEEFGDRLYIVSEHVEGRTLRDELIAGPVPAPRLLRLAAGIARALAGAHRQGIVHRDLKPENVIVTPTDEVKILDFGLALRVGTGIPPDEAIRLTRPGVILGTPGYLAPEQLLGGAVDFRADLFAFGVLLYECATGVHPFDADTTVGALARVIEGEPIAPVSLVDPAGIALPPIISRCLARDPERRYGSTDDLVRELEKALPRTPATVQPPGDGTTARRRTVPLGMRWWLIHQAVVIGLYLLVANQLRLAGRLAPGPVSIWLLLGGLTGTVAGVSLRLNLLFAARHYRPFITDQRRKLARVLAGIDVALAGAALVASAMIAVVDLAAAAVLVVLGAGMAVASLVIEPATTRMAFRTTRPRRRSNG